MSSSHEDPADPRSVDPTPPDAADRPPPNGPAAMPPRVPIEGTPEIDYPAEWHYQIVGRSPETIAAAIATAVDDLDHQIRPGRASAEGNWHSVGLSLIVRDEAHRLEVYERLRTHESVRLVL